MTDYKAIAIAKGNERDAILDAIEHECGFRPILKMLKTTTGMAAGVVVFGSVAGKYGFQYMRLIGSVAGNYHADVNGLDIDPAKHRRAAQVVKYLNANIEALDSAAHAHAEWQGAYSAWRASENGE